MIRFWFGEYGHAYGGFDVSLAPGRGRGLIASSCVPIAAVMAVWYERTAGPAAVAARYHQGLSASREARGASRAPDALQVAESAGFLLGHGHGDRVLAEVGYRVAEVVHEQGGHVLADAEADQDALHGDAGH